MIISKDRHVLVFVLTLMHHATGHCHYSELVTEKLGLELNITFPLQHVTKLIVLGERMSSVAVTILVLMEKLSKMDNVSIQQIFNRIPLPKCRFFSSFPSDVIPILPSENFAITNTQPSNMQGEYWLKIANSRHILYFAEYLCRLNFLKQL